MKNQLLQLMSQKQDTLKQMLEDCPEVKGTPKDDLLQDFYMFLFEKTYRLLTVEHMFPEGEFNRGLVFIVLRNFVYGEIRKDASKDAYRDEAHRAWKESKLNEEDGSEAALVSESNFMILDEIKRGMTEDEYNGILDLVERNLLAKFTDEDGNRDMVAYGKRYRGLYKKYKEVKSKSVVFKYITPEEIDEFEEFSNLTLKLK